MSSSAVSSRATNPADPAAPSRWFSRFDESGWPDFTLFCFPYAGGNANAYRRWASWVDPHIEIAAVKLPGRGPRVSEPLGADFSAIVDMLAQAVLADAGTRRFGFFGHSMGALMMFEVARTLALRGLRGPECVFASGRQAPHLPVSSRRRAALSDAEFVDDLRRLEGTPRELLDNVQLLKIFLPMIRADFTLLDAWRYEPSPPLAMPLYTLAGQADPDVPLAAVDAWAEWAGAGFEQLTYEGGHFFVHEQERRVVNDVSERVMRHLR